ncbi:hypothetical protein A8F94_22500 [Bacillus sp. FJAT-27225]|uniref:hypothetical protein n=1 Tax=Bacillus sp. FJAT-27225 TaxID=1743144 RepID=UPI00080C2533|nr:hypothetical protein [Bacillus sp. FJAT-27225]OCA81638.1 hypothetical protein A8F94_22500 [Bacillus sp. FJAT-27225]
MKRLYTVFYIAKKPRQILGGFEVLSFVGTKEEFLKVITSIILSKYGCYKVKVLQETPINMYIVGIKRRGRMKEFRVFIKDVPNTHLNIPQLSFRRFCDS